MENISVPIAAIYMTPQSVAPKTIFPSELPDDWIYPACYVDTRNFDEL